MAALCVVCCLFTVKKEPFKHILIDANYFYAIRFLHSLSTLRDFDILRDLFAF